MNLWGSRNRHHARAANGVSIHHSLRRHIAMCFELEKKNTNQHPIVAPTRLQDLFALSHKLDSKTKARSEQGDQWPIESITRCLRLYYFFFGPIAERGRTVKFSSLICTIGPYSFFKMKSWKLVVSFCVYNSSSSSLACWSFSTESSLMDLLTCFSFPVIAISCVTSKRRDNHMSSFSPPLDNSLQK